MNVPAIFVPAGAMLKGRWRQHTLGTGSSTWAAEADYRAGKITQREWMQMSEASARSTGTCNTMGTASTMATLIDVLGLSLPSASTIPAVDAEHGRMASRCRPAHRRDGVGGPEAFRHRHAGGAAQRRRRRHGDLGIDELADPPDRDGAPLRPRALARFVRRRERARAGDLQPDAGRPVPDGGPALRRRADGGARRHPRPARPVVHDGQRPHAGREHAKARASSTPTSSAASTTRCIASGALVVLQGIARAARRGAEALGGRGRGCSITSARRWCSRITTTWSRASTIRISRSRADSVLVLQEAGPIGAPGMPEWGMLPIPKKLLEAGVRDMVRISDARMSGTSYGTCVLHVCPESHVGGPLGLVRDGDLIRLDAAARRLDLLVDDAEMAARRAPGRRRPRTTSAATARCSRRTCCRPTKDATSTTSRGRASTRSRRFIERGGAAASEPVAADVRARAAGCRLTLVRAAGSLLARSATPPILRR